MRVTQGGLEFSCLKTLGVATHSVNISAHTTQPGTKTVHQPTKLNINIFQFDVNRCGTKENGEEDNKKILVTAVF